MINAIKNTHLRMWNNRATFQNMKRNKDIKISKVRFNKVANHH